MELIIDEKLRQRGILGAIIGDIVGSRFEFDNYKNKDFDFFARGCRFTDDSVMTLAVAKSLVACNQDYSNLRKTAIKYMQEIGRPYPDDYGESFYWWIYNDDPPPYGSWGDGAAMRVSACGFIANSLEQTKLLSRMVTDISHNHPEGIKGAEATAVAVYLARTNHTKDEIANYIKENYYSLEQTIDEIRDTYEYNDSCQGTVPQAIQAFLESVDFEDAIRNAISIGGDSDTIGAITGGIAAAFYGIPDNLRQKAINYLDGDLRKILYEFETF